MKFFEGDDYTLLFIYLLGRDGYQFVNLVFGEKVKYIDEIFLNDFDSFIFKEGKLIWILKRVMKIISTAADLVTSNKPELNLFISTEILCIDVINNVNKLELDEQDKLMIRSVASGFNLSDYYFADSIIGNNSSDEELLNNVSNYCLESPSDSLILAIVNALVGEY